MKMLTPALLAVATLIGPQISAQETLLERVLEACENDLDTYCDQVTPGEGRLLHCIAAHQDKISGRCDYALYQAATVLQGLSEAIYYVANECSDDIEKHCAGVKAGEGRILACLEKDTSILTEECQQALADTVVE